VFAVEKNCYALVVGDLSGKGLAAAAQVSIVRNMLRAFLYSKPAVTEAVTELNRVLAENNLLTGFSTLFVSVYDADTCCLRYVNCGQEPALLRRAATSTVEQLMPTGAILGSIENAQYTEELVTLAPGDALAIFTDGVTEVGSTRLKMLGIEGAIALLEQPLETDEDQDAEEIAEQLMLHMIAGVDAAAEGGVMRDDVCLLVAVAHSG
jgi:serine phosphatase RsbU (regulator of sigma subunit)